MSQHVLMPPAIIVKSDVASCFVNFFVIFLFIFEWDSFGLLWKRVQEECDLCEMSVSSRVFFWFHGAWCHLSSVSLFFVLFSAGVFPRYLVYAALPWTAAGIQNAVGWNFGGSQRQAVGRHTWPYWKFNILVIITVFLRLRLVSRRFDHCAAAELAVLVVSQSTCVLETDAQSARCFRRKPMFCVAWIRIQERRYLVCSLKKNTAILRCLVFFHLGIIFSLKWA